ncbi:MAK10-like protein [Tanacetum coccineum]
MVKVYACLLGWDGMRISKDVDLGNFVHSIKSSNWLERLPVGSITTWEDLTTRFLAQFFPPGRTAKLRNDILMFQQHHGESLSEAWTCFKDLLQKVPHHGIDRWLQIQNFYDHGSRPTPKPSSTHIPQAYAEAVYSNPYPQNQNEPPKQNPFTFRERTGLNPQPQALGTTFEARVRDYMAAHTERIEIFENAIFKQHEEINDRMTKMFENLKELTTSRAPEKRGEERSEKTDVTTGDDFEKPTKTEMKLPVKEAEKEDEAENEPNIKAEKEEKNEVFSTWMEFGGNTHDLSSFGEETDEITNLHQILEEVLHTERGDGVAGIKRRRRGPSSDGVWT